MHDRDTLHRFLFDRFPIRGHLVHLDAAWRALIEHRQYPPVIRETLGEAVVASLLVAMTTTPALCALLLIRSRALSPSQQSMRSQPSVQAGRTEPQGALAAARETGADSSSPARSA